MPYTQTTWLDEVPSASPVKYSVIDDSLGTIAGSARIQLVTPVTPGTPVNAANMNKLETGVATAQSAAEAAAAVAAAAVIKPTNPAANSIVQQSPAGVVSLRSIKQVLQLQLVQDSYLVPVGTYAHVFIPSTMSGMNLVRAQAMTNIAGSTGNTTIQVRNLTKYPSNDALSTAITILSGSTVGTVGVINTLYDDVSTNDKIKITVVSISTNPEPRGLYVLLEYQLP